MSSIIFDFDGTIADSLPLVLELFYDWAKIEPLPKQEIDRLRDMSLKEVIKDIGVPLWKVPKILVKARSQFGKRVTEVPVIKGIPDVLEQLSTNHKLYVMSSNSHNNISKFLKDKSIDSFFSGILGNIGLFGKATALKTIMRKYKLDPSECFYIGDEIRDIEAAKKAHVKIVAVNWGYNATEILKSHKPDYFVTEPKQITKLLK